MEKTQLTAMVIQDLVTQDMVLDMVILDMLDMDMDILMVNNIVTANPQLENL